MRYVTYLITYLGDKLPRFYIGSTSEKRALSGKYFGSVSSKRYKTIFLQEKKYNPNLFKLEILSYHDTREECLEEELKLQIELDVVKSIDYMNESLARVNGFFGRDISGENHPQYGTTLSEETKSKISNALMGHTESEETRKKKSDSKLGDRNNFFGKKHSDETKDKISMSKKGSSSWNKGIPMSEESKRKLSEAKKGKKASDETREKLRLAWIERKKKEINENN